MSVATAVLPHAEREQRRTGLTAQTVATNGDTTRDLRAQAVRRVVRERSPNYRGSVPKQPTRHRDRRGRGLRGVLTPRAVPLRRSRSDAFDDLVVESAIRLQRRWTDQLGAVEFLVEDVPPDEDGRGIVLGASRRAAGDQPARVTVYRRPVETRAANERARATLVHDVVVEQVAELLGLEPETVDPDYGLD